MKAMITTDSIVLTVKEMVKEYIEKYSKGPTIVHLGESQLQALEREKLLYSTTGEPSRIFGLLIKGAHASDFIGIGTEENEMSAISADLVKARAEQMLGEHFRNFDYPNFIVLGKEQFREAVMFLELSTHTDKTYFCGVEVIQVPISNYIGVM